MKMAYSSLFDWGRCFFVILLLWAFTVSSLRANLIPWTLSEVYSSADGSIEIIELSTAPANTLLGSGYKFDELNSGGTLSHFYATGVSQFSGGGFQSLLFATSGYAALPGAVAPDYIIPNNFLFLPGGMLTVSTLSPITGSPTSLTYAKLPGDGSHGLDASGDIIPAYAQNFAGQREFLSVSENSPTWVLMLIGITGLGLCFRTRDVRVPFRRWLAAEVR